MTEKVQIAIPADDKYWSYALVAGYSAVKQSSVPVVIHLIDGGISDSHYSEFVSNLSGSEVVRHRIDSKRWPS